MFHHSLFISIITIETRTIPEVEIPPTRIRERIIGRIIIGGIIIGGIIKIVRGIIIGRIRVIGMTNWIIVLRSIVLVMIDAIAKD